MKFLGLMCASALAIAVAAPASAQEIQLTLSHNAAPGNPKDEGSKHFAACMAEKSGNRIAVQVAGSAQLGDDAAMITGLRTGSIDMSLTSQGPMAAVVPEIAALGLPYLFDSPEHAWKVVDGPIGEELAKLADAKGMILLGFMDNGIRQTSNTKHPIEKPADLVGLKIRTPSDPITVAIFEALGANTQQIKFSELYIALQQGVVDGQENPLMNIYFAKLQEVQPYISLTGHKYETTPFLFSKKKWEQLSADDQGIVRGCAKDAIDFQRKLATETEARLLKEMPAQGVKINEVDRGPFREATQPVIDQAYGSPIGDFARRVVEAAKKAS